MRHDPFSSGLARPWCGRLQKVIQRGPGVATGIGNADSRLVGVAERAGEVRVDEKSVVELGAAHLLLFDRAEGRATQIGVDKVGADERGAVELGFIHACAGEVRVAAAGIREIAVAQVCADKIGRGEIGFDDGIHVRAAERGQRQRGRIPNLCRR